MNDALNILARNKTNNISEINFIKNNEISSVDIIGNSVLIRGISDRRWVYISCYDKDELYEIKSRLNRDDDNFGAIDDWIYPFLVEGKKIIWDLSMVQYYLPGDIHVPNPRLKTRLLTESDAGTIYDNSDYQEYISMEYVNQRIQKGQSAGLSEDDNLVCWAMTQDDGAIGFLHTLDNYRKKGYGYSITLSMIEKVRNNGDLPFAYVKESNQKSINLLIKLGFKKIKKVHWFQIK